MGAASAELHLTDLQWRRLNGAWVAYFLAMGAANLVAMRSLDDNGWMNFKLYSLGLTLLFVVAQAFWIAARTQGHDKPAG
jgi:intracellular septation protein